MEKKADDIAAKILGMYRYSGPPVQGTPMETNNSVCVRLCTVSDIYMSRATFVLDISVVVF